MIRRAQKKLLFLLIAAVIMLACVPTLAPAPTPFPTYDPNSLGTFIAGTADAANTQTALYTTPSSTPTFTLTPTKTPSETPTPTATFIFLLPTWTATPTTASNPSTLVDYACTVLAQSPQNKSIVGAGVVFTTRWQVKNTGMKFWDSNNIDYRYKSGTKLHLQPAYDLYKDIEVGGVADLIVDMTAPTTPGEYSTTWKMRAGKNEFCTLTLSIEVR